MKEKRRNWDNLEKTSISFFSLSLPNFTRSLSSHPQQFLNEISQLFIADTT